MKLSLRNDRTEIRNGWKCLFFILAFMGCFAIVGFVGHRLPPSVKAFAPSAILITALGLLISWWAVRLEGTSLASLGLRLDRRFSRQWAWGLLTGAAMVALCAAAVLAWGGVRLSPAAGPTLAVQTKMLVVFLGGAVFEELLFRGYAFQRAVRGIGVWPAILVLGLLFCVAHLPGNLEVGAALLTVAMANLLANSVLQSLLYLRTGSLALPIGLHFGWNLMQESLGFGVSGMTSSQGWFQVHLGQQPGWLSGGEFGLEASVFCLALQAALIAMLLAKGSGRTAPDPVPHTA